jgi:hypothetical protein
VEAAKEQQQKQVQHQDRKKNKDEHQKEYLPKLPSSKR